MTQEFVPERRVGVPAQLDDIGDAQARHNILQLLKLRLATVRQCQAVLVRQFVDEETGRLSRLATRMVGHQDAPDVLQEALVNLARWVGTRPVPRAMALLASTTERWRLVATFAARRARDHLRSKQRRNNRLALDETAMNNAADRAATARSEVAVDIERVARAYEGMPPEQRIAHVLHHYHGFTDADLAGALGHSKSHCRGLVHSAKLALRSAMEIKP